MRIGFITLALACIVGCASAPPEPPAGCNPLSGDDCATPFPSSFYETADATSPTGWRVTVADRVWPSTATGTPYKAAQLVGRDGFSPATPFVVYFKAGVDATKLPGDADLASSVQSTSTVQVIDLADGSHLPVMAELDANADPANGDRQSLIIRPMARLKNGGHYAVAIVGLHNAKGGDLTPPGFRALRDKQPLNKALTAMKASYEQLFTQLSSAGIARNHDLVLAWDVYIESDASVTTRLVTMRDTALAWVDGGHLGYHVTSSTDMPSDPNLLREIVGTIDVASFLQGDGPTDTLLLDGNGQPMLRGVGSAPFVVHIPKCAQTATAPLPVIVFGHGLFGQAQTELSTDYQKQLGNTLCMVQIGTDWIGLAKYDFPTIAQNVLGDLNHFDIVSDRLQQAHVNAQILTRLFVKSIKDDAALQVGGHAVTDGSQLYYYGISDGGIQGGTFMALSKDITRGVLNVPGSEWSLMMLRSADFNGLKMFLDSVYPDQLDQQILIAAMQSYWDYTDPINYAPHLLANPLPGTPTKHMLLQESIGDAQVPNLATRVLARAVGVPGNDLEQPVFGIVDMPAPLDSAYTQWDVHPTPLPADVDKPPMDNQAHEAIRRLPALIAQLQAFFKPNGMVTTTCTGPCVFPQ